MANVVPAYEMDEKDHVENYRPISLLCIISKVLEHFVLNRIKDRLEDLIAVCQHGFQSGRSCVANLLETLDYIRAILDRACQVDCVYLDMSKAFYKVRHDLLMEKSEGCWLWREPAHTVSRVSLWQAPMCHCTRRDIM